MPTTSLSISITTSGIIAKIRRNLAIIGKRAKKVNGDLMYSDLTASTNEDPIFDDLLMFGAETIVSELSDVASGYVESKDPTTSSQENKVVFTLTSTRWNKTNTEPDLTNALSSLISNYLYNFCLGRYLSEIHPSTGDKYPPLFGRTYNEHCELLIRNIKTLAFLKRPVPGSESKGYGDVKMSENTYNNNNNSNL